MGQKYCTYLRVSTRAQGESQLGLMAQRKMCEDYIAGKDGALLKEFQDVESGTHRNRPGLKSALDFCKEQECPLVIAKLDRLARDVEFVFKCVNSGVQLIFTDMPRISTLELGIFATIAQYERELISSRTKAALGAIKDEIRKNGGHVSKAGRYIKKLGAKTAPQEAHTAAAISNTKRAVSWRDKSSLYISAMEDYDDGMPRRKIVAKYQKRYEKDPVTWGTRNGKPLCEGTLSRWIKERA